ncbi:MAG TPA: diguanylate cyclase, partial [Spongiibacteraceae bacterium]|nr:diguanylate cyclase [Spongiibacteraceae bacterium]
MKKNKGFILRKSGTAKPQQAPDLHSAVLIAATPALEPATDILSSREQLITAREDITHTREETADQRDNVAQLREETVHQREEIAASSEKMIEVAETNKADLENHIVMLQQANEHLVITAIQAQIMTGEIQRAKDQMGHMAQHDFLTNLPNRVLLNDRLAQAIVLARRQGSMLAVLFLDLDNFKHVNDSLGHAIGDKLLQSVAQRLHACVRGSDTISRQGGDEFVVLVAENHRAEDAVLTADKIIDALMVPHAIAEHELHVTTSIGISVYPTDGLDAETLIKNADTAMYQAKEKGRNNYQFFTNDMNVRAVERQTIEINLRHALAGQQFVLHYQPKVNLQTGHITGAEALLRWMHPQWGAVFPDRFIAIAEDSGLIVPIGRWVLRAIEALGGGRPAAGLGRGQYFRAGISLQKFRGR